MGKFTKYGGSAKWDTTLKELEGCKLVIYNVAPTSTQYGPAYVLTCDVFDGKKQLHNRIKVLTRGQVPYESLTEYLKNSAGQDDQYPFEVVVIFHQRDGAPNYWVLEDPASITE